MQQPTTPEATTMSDDTPRCPDCNAIAPDLRLHQQGCSSYRARMAAQAEARRPRTLQELGRDAQIVAVAYDLRARVRRARQLPVPTDDQALAWAVRNDLDDPEVLLLAHALCTSRVTNAELRQAAYQAHCGGAHNDTIFQLLGIMAPEYLPEAVA